MIKRFSRSLSHFVTDHMAWEFLVRLLEKRWTTGLLFLGSVAGSIASWLHKEPLIVSLLVFGLVLVFAVLLLFSFLVRETRIAEIRFDYLPDRSPEQEGWELVNDQGPNRPAFSLAGDPPITAKC